MSPLAVRAAEALANAAQAQHMASLADDLDKIEDAEILRESATYWRTLGSQMSARARGRV